MLSFVVDYLPLIGGINAVILAIFLILATQYKYFYKAEKKPSKTLPPAKEESKAPGDTEEPETEATILKSLGYTEDRLKEIARCAQLLNDYDPPTTSNEDTELVDLDDKQAKTQESPKSKECVCTLNINKAENQDNRKETAEDQDEIDISDLVPDDITVAEDNDEEEEAEISPQAIADIEAEMLDSSILTENPEEQEVNITETGETGKEIQEEEMITTILGVESDQVEDVALNVASCAISMALSELGMESLIRENKEERKREEKEETEKGIEEKVFGEGEMKSEKSSSKKDDLQLLEDKTDALVESEKLNPKKKQSEFEVGDHTSTSKANDSSVQHSSSSTGMDREVGVVNNLTVKNSSDVSIKSAELAEETEKESNVTEGSGTEFFEANFTKDFASLVSEQNEAELNENATSTIQGSEDLDTLINRRVQELLNLSNPYSEDLLEARETESSVNLNESEKLKDQKTEVIYLMADCITRHAKIAAVEEIIDEEVPLLRSAGFGHTGVAKIQEEHGKLSEEDLSEERRVQQTQLEQILAVMQQYPDMFGSMTKDDFQDQANLYCV